LTKTHKSKNITSTTETTLSLSLSVQFNGHFPGEPGLANFIGDNNDGDGGDNWSYKTCKAPVKS